MGVLAFTVPSASDALSHAFWRKLEEIAARCDLVRRSPHNAQRMAPLVPGDSGDHGLVRRIVQVRERRMACVNDDDPKLLDPHATSPVKLAPMAAREPRKAGGGQQIIDEHPERLVDHSPLGSAHVLKQSLMSSREVAPRQFHESGRAIESLGSDHATTRSPRTGSSAACHGL